MLSTANQNRLKIMAILVLAIFCALIVYPKLPTGTPLENFWNKFKFHLGLDLQGGAHLVYNADTSALDSADASSAVAGVRDVIEKRVNAFGVSEPLVQTNQVGENYRVIVELAGVNDVNEAIKMIGETPLLEFKEQNPNYQASLTAEQTKELEEYNKNAEIKAQGLLKKALAGNDFATLAKENSEDSSASSGGDLGFVKRGMFVTEFDNVIFDKMESPGVYNQLVQTTFGYHIIKKIETRGEGDSLEIHSAHILIKTITADSLKTQDEWVNTELSGKHLTKAQIQFDSTSGEPEVGLEFNEEGKKMFGEITTRNVGKPVAIFLDGEPISVPNVKEAITDGKASISGRFNIKEAKQLVERLNAGALPVPITLISQETVGASLGKESLEKSLFAGLIGLIAVALFMLFLYRLPGLIAVLALALYTLINLAIYKIFGMTLTLAGIAGFILSIGMAVDANILIFERLKEEIKAGRETASAVDEAFKRAWTSIKDSNISSLITCLILYWMGTSSVKGFALTLSIGVLTSMFSAITVTRILLKLVLIKSLRDKKWLFG
ncbi:MAG TPA: protein translocase subunit SecD [bacterium]|nr:protein translocase subunit SecD [bacterium]